MKVKFDDLFCVAALAVSIVILAFVVAVYYTGVRKGERLERAATIERACGECVKGVL